MGILETALLTGALLLNSKPKKKRRKGKKTYTRKGIIARRKQWEREDWKLTQKALKDFARAIQGD
ncbi:MAG: hypothetical protein C4519_24455 [Desulfobacteraceae bacterium]|nr:MAG: hypothetical protein C4519_24455 [Desulfobacteraceae bacterium]